MEIIDKLKLSESWNWVKWNEGSDSSNNRLLLHGTSLCTRETKNATFAIRRAKGPLISYLANPLTLWRLDHLNLVEYLLSLANKIGLNQLVKTRPLHHYVPWWNWRIISPICSAIRNNSLPALKINMFFLSRNCKFIYSAGISAAIRKKSEVRMKSILNR